MTWIYFLAPYLHGTLVSHSYRMIPHDYLGEMAAYSALSLVALFVGFYATFRRPRRRTISPPDFTVRKGVLGRVAVGFIVIGLVSNIIDYYVPWVLEPLGQLLQVLDFAPVLALCVGLLYWLRGGRSLGVLVPLIIYFSFELALRTSETLFSKIAFLFAGLFLVYIIERRRIPWLALIAAFLLLFPIFHERTQFRMEAHNRWHYTPFEDREKIPALLSRGAGYLVKSYQFWNWGSFAEALVAQGRSRFEDISYLGQCVYQVEAKGVPLKYGATFWWLPLTPIPRTIFPWKPSNYHPTLLAIEYGLKGPYSKAAMNFPMLAEMYINFGFLGMVVLSFFQGVLYKWCLRIVSFGVGDLNLLSFVNILWHLEKVESNITMIFGGILQALLTWWMIARFVRFRRKTPTGFRVAPKAGEA
jgi:hypothetical protein